MGLNNGKLAFIIRFLSKLALSFIGLREGVLVQAVGQRYGKFADDGLGFGR